MLCDGLLVRLSGSMSVLEWLVPGVEDRNCHSDGLMFEAVTYILVYSLHSVMGGGFGCGGCKCKAARLKQSKASYILPQAERCQITVTC